MNLYYFHDGHTERGPFQFHELAKERLIRTTPVWREGLPAWTTVEHLPELASLIQAPPPFNERPAYVPPTSEMQFDVPERKAKSKLPLFLSLAGVIIALGLLFILFSKNAEQANAINELRYKQTINKMEADAQTDERKRLNEALTKRNMEYRNNWPAYISATTNNYRYSNLGGIYGLEIEIHNDTECMLDEVVASLTYYKANGDVWKAIPLTVTNIPAKGTKTVSVPDVERGTSVQVSIETIVSKKLHFYMAEGYSSGNPEDPYFNK